ncbi:MAG TPA: hypothetical protein VGM06_07735 [Polyangiaceae bacterium]|jgi:hypothetical protein
MAAHSRAALDRPLRCPAELWVAVGTDEGTLLGAFQRAAGMPRPSLLARRGSGGPEVAVGEGTVHVELSLEHPGAFGGADARRIVNRSVRPLLRGLTRVLGAAGPASYFGRDWVSAAGAPCAWVGFAHDATTRRTSFEAFVAVRAPFAAGPRASFRGKEPRSLEAVAGRSLDPAAVAEAVVEAYVAAAKGEVELFVEPEPAPTAPSSGDPYADPAWAATAEEAIGLVGAGPDARGVFRVGGDLLASRDAMARLELAAATAPEEELGSVVNAALGAAGVALDGVRSLATIRDVIATARFR